MAGALRTALRNYSEVGIEESIPEDGTDLPNLTRKGILTLARQTASPDMETLARAVIAVRGYSRHLLDLELSELDECLRAAATLSQHDTSFIAGLVRSADELQGSKSTMRALEILDGLGQSGVAAQWIRRMTADADASLRSKAVKILSKLYVNLSLIERQFESEDARVRANAVEGLWGEKSQRHVQLLERAAKDPHHRVAGNGLYGLYLAGSAGIGERMIQAANSSSPQHRAAIAWAMGKTGSPEFVSPLEKLAADSEECVRTSAARALAQLEKAPAELCAAVG